MSSRSDCNSPFNHNEFRICTDPRGLNYLYNNCYKNDGFFNSSHAVSEFLNYIEQVQNHKTHLSKNIHQKIYKNDLFKLANIFINKISDVQYFALPHYKRIGLTLREKINIKLNYRILKKTFPEIKVASIILLKDKKIFIKEAKEFIKKIIYNNSKKGMDKKKLLVLNNAADILNPIETSKFFKNPKIITVTRDPRDIFASMKNRQSLATPWYDVDIFIKWYKKCFDNNIFLKKKNQSILNLKFENVVNNFEKENEKICKFLKISTKFKLQKKAHFEFNLDKSKKNIQKSKKDLTKKEFYRIETKLKKHLQW